MFVKYYLLIFAAMFNFVLEILKTEKFFIVILHQEDIIF